jgi:hypothetical protein
MYSGNQADVPLTGAVMSAELTNLLKESRMYHPLTTKLSSQGSGNDESDHRSPEQFSWEHSTSPQRTDAGRLTEVLNPLLWNN